MSPTNRCANQGAGWSIGGVLAFEVARQLIASGVRVPGVLLIDSPHPQTTTPLSDDVINAAFTTNKSSPSRAMELARTQIQFATRSLVEYDPSTSPAKNARPPKAVMLRSREAFRVKTTDLTSQSDAFLAERSDPATMVAEWESILGCKVPVLDIPGNHFEPFDPRHVSPALDPHLFCNLTVPHRLAKSPRDSSMLLECFRDILLPS